MINSMNIEAYLEGVTTVRKASVVNPDNRAKWIHIINKSTLE